MLSADLRRLVEGRPLPNAPCQVLLIRARHRTLVSVVGATPVAGMIVIVVATRTRTILIEQFLTEMEQVLPWTALHALIRPHYYRETDRGPRSPAHRPGADAADVSAATVVQPGR